MAPSGRNTTTYRSLLFLSLAILASTSLILYLFHEELLSTLHSYTRPSCACDCASAAAVIEHEAAGEIEAPAPAKQALLSTTYTTLRTLEELAPANVLWINGSSSSSSDGEAKPEAWGISMFHGLHCLKMWKDSLGGEMGHGHGHGGEGMGEYREHSGHCVDYLVQVISCFADGTLEPPEEIVRPEDGVRGHRIQGMGYSHECRDASLLWEMDGKVVEGWEWRQGDTVQSVFSGLR